MENINGFECIAARNNSKTAVVVLHGYGANAQDLQPLGDYLDREKKFDWFFVNAPLKLAMNFMMDSRAWFPLTMREFEEALASGAVDQLFEDITPEGFNEITQKLTAWLESLSSNYEKIYLGGFSQGSMVSINLTMKRPELIHKLFILSGTLVNKKEWQDALDEMKSIPTFQSHGEQDPVLPFSGAKKLNEMFRSKPDHQFYSFQGGHEIPPHILSELGGFLHD